MGLGFEPDEPDETYEEVTYRWKVETVSSPVELEFKLNMLADEGWKVWSIYDRISEWVVLSYQDTDDLEE